jgi:hypothetical protein
LYAQDGFDGFEEEIYEEVEYFVGYWHQLDYLEGRMETIFFI